MQGAHAADAHQLPAQRRPSAMGAHGCVSDSELAARGELRQRLLGEIDLAQYLRVGGAQRGQQMLDAAAHESMGKLIRRSALPCMRFGFELPGPALECAALRRVTAKVIDDCVAQHGVEPGYGGLRLAQIVGVLQRAHVGALQNVFRERTVADAPLHKRQEARATMEQSIE